MCVRPRSPRSERERRTVVVNDNPIAIGSERALVAKLLDLIFINGAVFKLLYQC